MSKIETHHNQESWVARFFRRLAGLRIVVREEPYERAEAGGTTMAYRLTPPGDLRGRIVFAHATGNDSLFPQAELFLTWLEAGFEIFTFDLDGHGAHSTTILSPQSAPTMIPQAVEVATKERPPLALFGAGQSLGAALWLKTASQAVVPLTSMVLFSAPYTVDLSARAGSSELLALLARDFWSQKHHYGWTGIVPPLGLWRRQDYPIRMVGGPQTSRDRQVNISSLNYPRHIAALIESLDTQSIASSIKVPTLLIYGTRDKIVSASQGERLMELLPQGKLVTISGATHYTTPFHPEGMMAATRWFLCRDNPRHQ